MTKFPDASRARIHGVCASSQPAVRHRATRALAHHARDAADLALLLESLGLSAAEGLTPPPPIVEAKPPPPPRRPRRTAAAS